MSENPIPPPSINIFDRRTSSEAEARSSLSNGGYPVSMIDRWVSDGRLRPDVEGDGGWWSDVSPVTRALCYEYLLCTDEGREAWRIIFGGSEGPALNVHVMVAGGGTVCEEGEIKEMARIAGGKGDRLKLHRYPGAAHSIHNSATDAFIETLVNVVRYGDESDPLNT
mmetsp:Transcript_49841/g.97517  ORF Transcript_49841/g.97517 Transcript_49841/m.97517 type:complete len:167 (+) Transcript_49841:109-609(+)